MHPMIREIVAYAKNVGINRIAISTNGSNDFEVYESLIRLGVNDYSISLDACCSEDGDKMAGGLRGSWQTVVENIKRLSELTYVTVGIVLTPNNIQTVVETVLFASSLGVADIRIISAAQHNQPIEELAQIPKSVLAVHPILAYRVTNILDGRNVRGLRPSDSSTCYLVLDDSVIAGEYHFPCVIYMREKGEPIGKVCDSMREDRVRWSREHNCQDDTICRNNCLDVCIDYNNTCVLGTF